MPTLSRKAVHSIEAVLDIACYGRGETVQSREISERQNIPPRYLEPVLQELVRTGILAGVRGPRGGYRLARERRRITLGEIVEVAQSLETAGDPIDEHGESDIARMIVRPRLRTIRQKWLEELHGITIEDLFQAAKAAGVPDGGGPKLDFTI